VSVFVFPSKWGMTDSRYTGKDQVRPLNAVKKQRNCHIKFAAYDDEVLIIGNGNQGGLNHSFRGILFSRREGRMTQRPLRTAPDRS
jgi:hypothetical protein